MAIREIKSLELSRQEMEGCSDSEWAQFLEGLVRQYERAYEGGDKIEIKFEDT